MGARRRDAKRAPGMFLFCTSMFLLFNALGVGYGYWSTNITVNNIIKTGCMDVIFTKCQVEDDKKSSIVSIVNDESNGESRKDKKIIIQLDDVKPGETKTIKYTIENKGTIDVFCKQIAKAEIVEATSKKVIQPDDKLPITVKITEPLGKINENKNTGEGTIEIKIGDKIENNKEYKSNYNLVFNNASWEDSLVIELDIKSKVSANEAVSAPATKSEAINTTPVDGSKERN